jgi:hypothetical protein
MTTSYFRTDNPAGYHTLLWRTGGTGNRYVWRDAPPGEAFEIQFDDEDGHPVDCFGLPLFGKFLDDVPKSC